MTDRDDEPEGEDEEAEVETLIPSATDQKQAKKLKAVRKLRTREASEFWAKVFNDPVGRRVMWDILEMSHAFDVRFPCAGNGAPYQEAMLKQLGESAFGHRLWLMWMRMAREGCLQMMTEFDPGMKVDG